MSLNFAAGKTECVVRFNGIGARKLESHVFVECNSKVAVQLFNGQIVDLRFVRSYKHVGTMTAMSHDICHEVSLRANVMLAESKWLNKHVFSNPCVHERNKILLAQAYVYSKGCVNAGVWPVMHSRTYTKFHAAVMKVYRRIACGSNNFFDHAFADDDIIYDLK
eukprot:6125195-Karenia_brevis.AAC.1